MKALIMDEKGIQRAITRISHEIIEKNKGAKYLVIVGIKSRGIDLGRLITNKINQIESADIPFLELDISYYRDDINTEEKEKRAHSMSSPKHFVGLYTIENKIVVLVDDVLYTGRTVRAALNALLEMGRPKFIQLAVLIDRGHRELPIRADYVGKNVPTSEEEKVKVWIEPTDESSFVAIY